MSSLLDNDQAISPDEIREALSKKLIDDFFEKPLNISYIYNSITSFE